MTRKINEDRQMHTFGGTLGKRNRSAAAARSRRRALVFGEAGADRMFLSLEDRVLLSTITRTSANFFYIDTKNLYSGNNLTSEYVSYKITNTDGKAYTDVYAKIGNFSGGNVSLGANASDTYALGSLANGASGNAFFYLSSTGTVTATDQTHTVTFYDGLPSLNHPIVTQNFTLTDVQDANKSSSNKITGATLSKANPTVGDTFNLVLTGTTGTVGSNNSSAMYFTPSAFADFPASSVELVSTQLQFTGGLNKTYSNLLLVPQADASHAEGSSNYTATFTFRAVSSVSSSTTLSPTAYIASGSNNVAHNDVTQLPIITGVAARPTTTTLTIPASSPTYGQSNTFTVNVAASGATPTAGTTVQLYIDSALVQSSTIDGSGNATFTVARLTAATHDIQAKYVGDSRFAASQSTTKTLTVTPAPLSVINVTANDRVYNGGLAVTLNTGTAALTGVIGSDAVNLVTSGATGAVLLKRASTGKTVFVSGLTLSGADAFNYTLTQPTTTVNITPATLTVTGVTAGNKVYDTQLTASLNTGSAALSGVITGDVVTLGTGAALGAFASKTVGTAKPVNVSGLTIGGTDAGNYVLTQPTTSADITPLSLVGGITAANKVYDESLAATITSRTLTGVLGSDQVSYVGGTATFDNVHVGANKTVTAIGLSLSGSDAGNYTVNTTAVTQATITKRSLVVTANNASKTYGDGFTFNGTEFTTQGLLPNDSVTSVTFASNGTSATAPVSGSPYVIIPSNAVGVELDDYVITYVTGGLTVNKRTLTVTATANDMVYDGSSNAPVSLTGNHLIVDVVTINYAAANFSDKNVGTGKTVTVTGISISGLDAGNYTLASTTALAVASITPLAVEGSAAVDDKEYDRTTAAVISGRTLTGTLPTDTVGIVGGTATFDTASVGTGKTVTITGMTLTGPDAGNYKLNTTATTTGDITKRALDITADDQTKTYGNVFTFNGTEYTQIGLLTGDTITSVTLNSTGAAANAQVNLSPYAIVPSAASGTGLSNYRMIFHDGLLTVDKRALNVTATASNKVYDATTAASVTLSGDNLVTDIVTLSYSTASFVNKNVGTGKTVNVTGIGIAGADAANYTLQNTSTTAAANIAKADLTVTATASNKVYDGLNTATVTLADNHIGSDVVTPSNSIAAFADKNVGTGKLVGAAGISISGADAGNYNLLNTTASATAAITPKALTGTITASNKEYDRTDAATISGRFLSGVISGDSVSYVGGTATFNNANPGTAKPVNATGLSLSGADAGNYTVNTSAATSADITARVLTITANNSAKTYGDVKTFLGTEFTSTGLLSGDSITSVTLVSAGSPARAAVSGSPYAINASNAVGVGLGGYSITYVAGSLSVATKSLTVFGITANGKVYNGTTATTVNIGEPFLSGVVSGDTVTLGTESATGVFADKNVGNGKVVTIVGLTLGGADAGNYTLTNPVTTANITKATLVGSVTVFDKEYDEGTSATINTRTLTGVFGSDVVSLVGGTASFQTSSVGTNKPVDVTGLSLAGADAGNYNVNSTTSTTANITALHVLIITAKNATKTYGDTVTFTGNEFTTSGLVGSDSVTSVTLVSAGTTARAAVSGSPYAINASNAVGSGLAAYDIIYVSGNLTVTAKALTVSGVTAANKVYDGGLTATPNAGSASLNGVVTGDSVALVSSGITGTFATKTVADGKTVTIAGLTLSGGDAANYTVTQPTTTANITPATLTTYGVSALNKMYDGNAIATVYAPEPGLIGIIGNDVVSLVTTGGVGSFANKNVGTNKLVTITGLTLGSPDAGNYTLTQPTATADITPQVLTVTATAEDKTYDGTTVATVTLSNNKIFSDFVDMAHATAFFDNRNVGTDKNVTVPGVTIFGPDAGNYVLASNIVYSNAKITKLALIGSITADSKPYDSTNAATIASRSLQGVFDGDSVNYVGGSATFDSIHVGTGRTVTATGLGLSGSDAGNYSVNTTAQTTADITKRALTITAKDASKTYGEVLVLDGSEYTEVGLLSEDSISSVLLTTTGAAASAQVHLSPYAIVPSDVQGTGLDDYRVVYENGKLVVNPRGLTVSASAENKTYDGDTTVAVTMSSNHLNVDVVNINYVTADFDNKNAGDGKTVTVTGITIGGADAENYTLLNTTAFTTANVTKLSVLGIISVDDREYNGTDVALIAGRSLEGVLIGDDVSYVGGTATFADIHVGSNKLVTGVGLGLGGADAGNYSVNSTAFTTADITKRDLVIKADDAQKRYGVELVFQGTEFTQQGLLVDDSITNVTFACNGAAANSHVELSPYAIVPSNAVGFGLDDYRIIYEDGGLVITPRLLKVDATANDKVYDATTAAVATLSCVHINGDIVSLTYDSATFDNKNAGLDKLVTVTGVQLHGEDATNYYLKSTTVFATADVTPMQLTVTAAGVDRVYDRSTNASVILSDNHLGSDSIDINIGSATFSDKNVGVDKTIGVAGLSISGPDAGNYELGNTTVTTTASVTPFGLTVKAKGVDKVYDGTTAATVIETSDQIEGDILTLYHDSATYEDKNAGVDKPISVVGIRVGGPDAQNYELLNTVASTSATVARRILTVVPDGLNKTYDNSVAASVGLMDNRIYGDLLDTSYVSAEFLDPHAGTGKTVNVTGISVTGADAGNYDLESPVASTTADIFIRDIAVTANPQTKIYGNPDPALTYFISSGSLAPGDAFTGALDRAPGEALGSYPILIGSLALTPDYSLGYTGANLLIASDTSGTITSSSPLVFFGEEVDFTATFTAPKIGSFEMTGTVSFYEGERYLGAAPITQATLSAFVTGPNGTASGHATLPVSSLSVGTHVITAVYSGDAHYATASTDTPVEVMVEKAQTQTTLTAVTNPQGTILSATVVATTPGDPPINGTVTFYEGDRLLGTAELVNGVASLNVTGLPPGVHSFRAVYGGDASASSSGTVTPISTDGPKVKSVKRYGYHFMPTVLVLTFDQALDPASAQDVANYRITGAHGSRTNVATAVYDDTNHTVTLYMQHRLGVYLKYTLVVKGRQPGGLTSENGVGLDGSGKNRPGTNYTTKITHSNLVITNTLPNGQPIGMVPESSVARLTSAAAKTVHSFVQSASKLGRRAR